MKSGNGVVGKPYYKTKQNNQKDFDQITKVYFLFIYFIYFTTIMYREQSKGKELQYHLAGKQKYFQLSWIY